MKRTSGAACLLVCILLLLATNLTEATETVMIEVKGGVIVSMTPSELFGNRDYEIRVKVLDEEGKPVKGAKVELSLSGGIVAIIGDSSATTGSDGVAILRTRFGEGGIVKLALDGKKVDQLFIYYESFPPLAGLLQAIWLLLICGTLGYLVYTGPVKWYLEERARK